jgi:hypothetical protein
MVIQSQRVCLVSRRGRRLMIDLQKPHQECYRDLRFLMKDNLEQDKEF